MSGGGVGIVLGENGDPLGGLAWWTRPRDGVEVIVQFRAYLEGVIRTAPVEFAARAAQTLMRPGVGMPESSRAALRARFPEQAEAAAGD